MVSFTYTIYDNTKANLNSYEIAIFTFFVVIILSLISFYIYARNYEQRRIKKMLAPYLNFMNKLTYIKKDRLCIVKKYSKLHEIINKNKKQDQHRYHVNLYIVNTIYTDYSTKNIMNLHHYLCKIMTKDQTDYDIPDYGYKTIFELENYLRLAYRWRYRNIATSLYYFAVYFDGVVLLNNTLISGLNDNYNGIPIDKTILEVSMLKNKYNGLIKRYLSINQDRQHAVKHSVKSRCTSCSAGGSSLYTHQDFTELERCFITYIRLFYGCLDTIYKADELG